MRTWIARLRRHGRILGSLGSSLLLQARNLVVSLLVFRWFDDPVTLWGTVNHVAAVVTLLALPAKAGLETTAVQIVSRYRDDAPSSAVEALVQSTALRVLLTVVVGLPMLALPETVGPWLALGDVPELVRIGGLLLVSISLYEFASFVLGAVDRFGAMMAARTVYTVVNLVGILAVVDGWTEDAAGGVLLAQVAGGLAATAWATVVLVREALRLRGKPVVAEGPHGRELLTAIVSFALPVTVVSIASQAFNYLDRVMIPVLADREALGSYAVANSVIAAALFGTYAFRNVARMKLPALRGKDDDEARAVLLATYRACVTVGALIAAGSAAVAPDLLVVLYGPDAAEAGDMLRWFIPFVLLSAHANFSATALVAADEPRTYAWLMGALSVVNFGLNLALIPVLGGHGAIAASTLSLVPLSLLAYRQVAKAYGEDVLWGPAALRAAMPTTLRLTALGALAAVAGAFVSAPTALLSVAGGLVVVAVFGAGLWLGGDAEVLRRAT